MKKILIIIPAIIIAFASTQLMAKKPANPGKAVNFVPVCHKVNHPPQGAYPADKPPKFILWVPDGAAHAAHLAHGDVDAIIIPTLDPLPDPDIDNPGHGRDKNTKGKGAFSTDAFITYCEEQAAFCGDFEDNQDSEECDLGPRGGDLGDGTFCAGTMDPVPPVPQPPQGIAPCTVYEGPNPS